jgi:hypothetical protein
MINPSANPHGKTPLTDDPGADFLRFGRMLCGASDDVKTNILPIAVWKGFYRTLKYPAGSESNRKYLSDDKRSGNS